MEFPTSDDYQGYFSAYINNLPVQADPLLLLERLQDYANDIWSQVSEKQSMVAYASGKWTPKELLLHLNDSEQVFAYRALRFMRDDFVSALPFDQDDYVAASHANSIPWITLQTMADTIRSLTLQRFRLLTEAQSKVGGSEAFPVSLRAVAALTAGHQWHHLKVFQERYLEQPIKALEL